MLSLCSFSFTDHLSIPPPSSCSRALWCSLMKNGLSAGHLSALCDHGPHLLHATSNTVKQAGSSTCAYLSYGNVLLPFSCDLDFEWRSRESGVRSPDKVPIMRGPQTDKWFSEGTGNLSTTVCYSALRSADCSCSVKTARRKGKHGARVSLIASANG